MAIKRHNPGSYYIEAKLTNEEDSRYSLYYVQGEKKKCIIKNLLLPNIKKEYIDQILADIMGTPVAYDLQFNWMLWRDRTMENFWKLYEKRYGKGLVTRHIEEVNKLNFGPLETYHGFINKETKLILAIKKPPFWTIEDLKEEVFRTKKKGKLLFKEYIGEIQAFSKQEAREEIRKKLSIKKREK